MNTLNMEHFKQKERKYFIMYKLKLADNTEIGIENTSTEDSFQVAMKTTAALDGILLKLTDENLKHIDKYNDEGLLYSQSDNKKFVSADIKPLTTEQDYIVTFNLRSFTKEELLERRLQELEAEQATQNDAIAEMSETVYA